MDEDFRDLDDVVFVFDEEVCDLFDEVCDPLEGVKMAYDPY